MPGLNQSAVFRHAKKLQTVLHIKGQKCMWEWGKTMGKHRCHLKETIKEAAPESEKNQINLSVI